MKIALVQPRYPHGKSQIYLPGGLLNLGSRLMQVGFEVDLFDLNLDLLLDHRRYDIVGFSVLGPPYIPGVIREITKLKAGGFEGKVLVGGEGVARLVQSDFDGWFGKNCVRIANDNELARVLGRTDIPTMYETSMRAMLERLPLARQKQYLAREFGLFMSQGCKFNCKFCAAKKATAEMYRSQAALEDEVICVCKVIAVAGGKRLECYISNLDCFQNVHDLELRLATIARIAGEHKLLVHIRALATSRCTVEACRKDARLAQRLRNYGLRIVGFGADGADEEVWQRENKHHNNLGELREAVQTMCAVGITAEILMVFGFKDDSAENIQHDLDFCFEQARAGAVIRPYLGKTFTPSGNWPGAGKEGYELTLPFHQNPELLLNLDYAMCGSKYTHPDPAQRKLANRAYLEVIGKLAPRGLCPTRPLLPIPARGIGRWLAQLVNRLMPFDR